MGTLDYDQLPLLLPFKDAIKLGKEDHIPHSSCQDAVDSHFIAFHLEMGIPIIPVEDETRMFTYLCLYLPATTPQSRAKTRLLPLKGLFKKFPDFPENLFHYVQEVGDGWKEYNSGRISCLGRFVDAALGKKELTYMRDFRIAEWFQANSGREWVPGRSTELSYYKKAGLDLLALEHLVHLQPGDLLIIDNTRVAHGKLGKRNAEELYQLQYGVESMTRTEVETFSREFVHELC